MKDGVRFDAYRPRLEGVAPRRLGLPLPVSRNLPKLSTECSSPRPFAGARASKVRPFAKFKDAYQIGIPMCIVVGRDAAEGKVEWSSHVGGNETKAVISRAKRSAA